jgi:hypothetical protein
MGRTTATLAFAGLLSLSLGSVAGFAGEWRQYHDPSFGYSVTVPDDGFDIETDKARNGLTLYEQGGRAQIDVYAIHNETGLSLDELRARLSDAERIKQITYSRTGQSWFVISGYYRRPADQAMDLIFYAKFMMSTDGESIAAFEASYPVSEKRRFDPIIERMESSLRAPN